MGQGVGVASACASATVVNAIATGKGASFGIDLRVMSKVKLTSDKKISGRVLGVKGESPKLIEICVKKVLNHLGLIKSYGALIETGSDIPIAVGLSSSSAAANAAVMATFAALDKKPKPKLVLDLAIDAAFEAKVTITGALDDAAASFYGHGVVTDNLKQKILNHFELDPKLMVLIHVPPSKFYTSKTSSIALKPIKEVIEMVHNMARRGEVMKALTINGLLYASSLGYDPMVAIEAISKGALAAGLSGTGPATIALAKPRDAIIIAREWQAWNGRIIITRPAMKGARVEGLDAG